MKNSKEKIALIIILLIQITVYIFLGTQKIYLHMDEAYSIGLTNYNKVEITDNEDFYDNWHKGSYYEDYIAINSDEISNFEPVYENQKNDVHPPFYYLLLRIASNFSVDKFSKWPGLILNFIILVISNIFVYKILKIVIKNNIKLCLAICLVNGLVVSSLESVLYIRMYSLNALLLLIIAYLHLINFRKDKIDIKNYLAIGITTLIASLTHYYNVLYVLVIALIYIINYIRKKQYKNIFKYIVTMLIAAAMSLVIFPYSIQHIFFGYRGQGAIGSLAQAEKMLVSFVVYIYLANANIFNSLLGFILIFFLIVVIAKLIKNKKITIRIENVNLLLITIPAIAYFIVVALVSPYMEIRYIIPICSFIFIFVIYLLNVILNKITKKDEIICIVILAIILIMPILIHTNINNLYIGHKEIVKEVEEKYHSLPTIYIFNPSQNRFLDDIYLFAKTDESYIFNIEKNEKDYLKEVLKDKKTENGIIVWINEGFEREEYLQIIKEYYKFNECKHLKRMNACDIYYIY